MKLRIALVMVLTVMGWLALPVVQAAETETETAAPAAKAPRGDKSTSLKTSKERYSYAKGILTGAQLQQFGDSLDVKSFMTGLQDRLNNKPSKLTDEELNQANADFQEAVKKEVEKKLKIIGERNQKMGTEFLAANASKKGVVTTASGLQYEVLNPGNGSKPKVTDQVKVHYHGTLIDNTVFDSSLMRKEPLTLPLNAVIPGWAEGLQLMPVGSKYRFVIPAKLAYGSKGAPPKITPESTLIFEVELLEIVKEGSKPEEKKAPEGNKPEERKPGRW
ncbi:MAG: FKBP-type peptidyl-prolyl cis-trans isomerase [Magnetococcales bacterium]|nr:FKBP-type peptidyl-prolyl cis-trans isomerase [Magnetococcales bacterium]